MSDITSQVKEELRAFACDLSEFKMGRLIGEGGFGKVYLAVHQRTKRKCAVKTLYAKELRGVDLDLFIRETENLAMCDNLFCLPFLGCTLKYPFSIITQYIPNGSLFNALKHKEGSPDLSGTDKTIIAMGVARGMDYLHKKGIIHRDLKSLNILLDDRKLPIVCDFGLSRQEKEDQFMTKDVGTPHWMAPELFESTNYTSKVDVYAFGMLMWEMLTESAPFKGMTSVQILYAVLRKKERPAFPKITPQPMKDFINRCWHQDPDKRPTMEEIYREFKEGKVAFTGTDRKEIIHFAKFIKKDEASRAEGKYKDPPLMKPAPTPHKKPAVSVASSKSSSETVDYSLLSKPDHPKFLSNFKKAVNKLTEKTSKQFFQNIYKLFIGTSTDITVYKIVLPPIVKAIRSNNEILKNMLETGLYYYLPFGELDLLDVSMMISFISVTSYPIILNNEFLPCFDPIVSQCPDKMLSILTLFFKPGDHQKSMWDVCDFIRKHADTFLNQCGTTFLQFIYYIFYNNTSVRAVRLSDLVAILSKAVTMSDSDIVHSAYCCICALFDQRIVIDQITLTQHLKSPNSMYDAVSYLARKPNIQVTPELIDAILAIAPKEKIALSTLYDMAMGSEAAGQILIDKAPIWMSGNTFKPANVISLILILVSKKSLRHKLAECQLLSEVLSNIPETKDINYIDISTNIVLKMIDEPLFFTNLGKYNYFKSCLQIVIKLNNIDEIKKSIMAIETISRKFFIPDFMGYVPYLFSLLQNNNELTFPALTAMTVLSGNEKVCEIIRKYDYKRVLKQLNDNPSHKVYVASLQKNLST